MTIAFDLGIMKRVLICDDDRDLAYVTSLIMKRGDYDVKVVKDGKTIVDTITEFRPHLLLLDVMLPGETGVDIAKKLRNTKETRSLPIVLLTAVHNPEELVHETGAVGVITKPFDVHELLLKVKQVLDSR